MMRLRKWLTIVLASFLLVSAAVFAYLKAFYKTTVNHPAYGEIVVVAQRASPGPRDFTPPIVDKSSFKWGESDLPGNPPPRITEANLFFFKFARIIMSQSWTTHEVNGKLVSDNYEWTEYITARIPPWTSLATMAGIITLITLRVIDMRKRAKNDLECKSCGYNLTGNTTGKCPECGTPISMPTPFDPKQSNI